MPDWEDQRPKDVRLLLLKRLLSLQAGLIVAGVVLLTVLIGVVVYFNARLARMEQEWSALALRPAHAPEVPTFWIRPPPLSSSQPSVALRKSELPTPSSKTASQPAADDQVAALLRDLSALVKAGPAGAPELADKNAARSLAARLDELLHHTAKIDPQLHAELSLSRVWLSLGEPQQALPWAEAACQQSAGEPANRLHLATVKAQLRDWTGAVSAAKEVIAAAKTTPRQSAEARLLLGQSYRGLRQLDQAAAALADTVAFCQASVGKPVADKDAVPVGLAVAAALAQAEVLLDLSKYTEALSASDTAKKLGADAPTADALRGEALARLNRYPEALEALKPLASAASPPARALLFFGIAQLKTNDPQAAALTFDQLEKLRPEWNLAWHWRGVAALAINQPAEAREHLSKAVALQPNYGPSWESLGLAQLNSQQLPQAVESLAQAVELPDSTANAGLFLALAYTRQNMTDAAKAALEKAIVRDPAVRDRARQIAPLAALLGMPTTQAP